MAAANAITSVELFTRLKDRPRLSFVASDYFDALDVVDVPGSRWRIIFDASGEPLQFVGRRLVIDAQKPERRRFPVNRLVRHLVAGRVLPKAREILAERGGRHIPLFHPRAIALSRDDPRFTLEREDAIHPRRRPFDVIRVTSLFAPGRFPIATVTAAIERIVGNLSDGGLFIIGSTRFRKSPHDRTTITIFVREGDRLKAVRDLGDGAALRDLLLGLRIPAA